MIDYNEKNKTLYINGDIFKEDVSKEEAYKLSSLYVLRLRRKEKLETIRNLKK